MGWAWAWAGLGVGRLQGRAAVQALSLRCAAVGMQPSSNLRLHQLAAESSSALAGKHPRALQGKARDVKQHKWFEGFDWDALAARKIAAPRKPRDDAAKRIRELAVSCWAGAGAGKRPRAAAPACSDQAAALAGTCLLLRGCCCRANAA